MSFSRAGGYSAAAATLGFGIGVDIESIARVSLHPLDDVLLHPRERTTLSGLSSEAAARYRAGLWVSKEAVLKSTGSGLRIDPRQICVELRGMTAQVESWPTSMEFVDPPLLELFGVTDDVIGAVAVIP